MDEYFTECGSHWFWMVLVQIDGGWLPDAATVAVFGAQDADPEIATYKNGLVARLARCCQMFCSTLTQSSLRLRKAGVHHGSQS